MTYRSAGWATLCRWRLRWQADLGFASLACVLLATSAVWAADGPLTVLPSEVEVRGSESSHGLLVQQRTATGLGEQVIENVEWSTDDSTVAVVQGGRVVPVSNGTTTLTARVGDATAATQVTVRDLDEPVEWSFRNHVQPVLAKMGCNSGACHGALAGKGGFKLSLRGYDTFRDHRTITRQARGRRIELSDPGRSLLLAKPSGGIPHKGGLRFEVDSLEYRVLSEWVAAGAKPPTDNDVELDYIEVLPGRVQLKPGDRQRVLVRAFYSDGRVEDVTRWAKFTSADEAVARIDQSGELEVLGYGEGAVTAWFASKIVIVRITVPYENEVSARVFAEAKRRNFIDDLVLSQLERLRLPPSPAAADEVFLRRAFLDTIGTLPTSEETEAFLADGSPDKRDKLIDALLERPEFVDYWTYKWSDVLLITGNRLRPQAVKAYYTWLRGHVESNTPWDELVREIVTAQGSSIDNGATNFFALHQDPEAMSENVAQAFLGLSIGCAKCHNHPLEKWTNDQYYAMANLFSRVRAKGWGGDPRNGDGQRTVFVVDKGELIQPLTGKPQPPTPLDGGALSFDATGDRRVHLAKWLTSADNAYFARSITNRVWANFFGVGLVEPIDDMRVSNPATNEELLAAAADYLIEERFDLKSLMRVILQSETYQRSSQALPQNEAERQFYSRYYPRRLMAEVLLDAISQVSGVPTIFDEIAFTGTDRQKTDFYPEGTRALQLFDAAVDSYFLKTFGRNERLITCECERSDEPSLVQVLHISNGVTINEKLAADASQVTRVMDEGWSNYHIIERVYLAALSRYPTDKEMQRLLEVLNDTDPGDRRITLEDLFWSVMSSREFLFNH